MTRVAPALASAHDSSGSTTTTFFSQRSGRRSSSGQGATERDVERTSPHWLHSSWGENEAGPTTAPKGGTQLMTTLVYEAGSFSSVYA